MSARSVSTSQKSRTNKSDYLIRAYFEFSPVTMKIVGNRGNVSVIMVVNRR
ncbi:MAG: hypothetical protein WBP64_11705 [Nitrososphaeraceae archaeon]